MNLPRATFVPDVYRCILHPDGFEPFRELVIRHAAPGHLRAQGSFHAFGPLGFRLYAIVSPIVANAIRLFTFTLNRWRCPARSQSAQCRCCAVSGAPRSSHHRT